MSALQGLLGVTVTPKVTPTSEARLGTARVEQGVEDGCGHWGWTVEQDGLSIADIAQWDALITEVAHRHREHQGARIAYRVSLTSAHDGQTRAAYFPVWPPTT